MAMTLSTVHYELGGRVKFNFTAPFCWKNTKSIKGVLAYARDESTGEYIRVYEVAPTEWVDNEPQAWSSGNFETVESAKLYAEKAYRWINRKALK